MKGQGLGFAFHGVLLLSAGGFASYVWLRDKDANVSLQGDVIVWQARSSDLTSVRFEGKKKKVNLEAKKDGLGRYFTGTMVKEAPTPPPPESDAATPPPVPAATSTTVNILSVGQAEKLADAVAPLRAVRSLGHLPDDRLSEFGLSDPDGTVTLTIGGIERAIVFGASTPGGSTRYARLPSSGEVYVLQGQLFSDLESADFRLIERELHDWKDVDVASATLMSGDKARKVVRSGPEEQRFWADASHPEANDETVGNWMSKLERMRPTQYETAAPSPSTKLLRIQYSGPRGQDLGFLELVRADVAGKPEYFITTERIRLSAKVIQSQAEQVEQDLAAVVK